MRIMLTNSPRVATVVPSLCRIYFFLSGGGGGGSPCHMSACSANLVCNVVFKPRQALVCLCVSVCVCLLKLRRHNAGRYFVAEALSNWTFRCRQNWFAFLPALARARRGLAVPFCGLRVVKPRPVRYVRSCFLRSKFILTLYIYPKSFYFSVFISILLLSFFRDSLRGGGW